jgi:hypothetical protein
LKEKRHEETYITGVSSYKGWVVLDISVFGVPQLPE